MPDLIENRTVFTLLEVTESIQRTLSARYQSSFWVKAEMNKINHYPQSGHCYPEMVEKRNDRIIAQMRATLWKEDYNRIDEKFRQVLKEPLKNGIMVLFCARITFDPAYGLALHILDVDPVFSLGELEKEKQETIEKLKKENIFGKNKELEFPLLPKRIAVISVETSKGFADFRKVIAENDWGYRFFTFLFPAVIQGDKAVDSILLQLKRIRKVISHFDVVAIIRGGGGDVGLSCYNKYRLAREIALFPLPVITGIGHATNETVSEMVAFRNAITPTELGGFLLQKFHNFSVPVQKAHEKLARYAVSLIRDQWSEFRNTLKYLSSVTRVMIGDNRMALEKQSASLSQQSVFMVRRERKSLSFALQSVRKGQFLLISNQKSVISQQIKGAARGARSFLRETVQLLSSMETSIRILSPENILKRGFSITRLNGKSVRSHQEVKEGDHLETQLADGMIASKVDKTIKNKKNAG